MATPRHQRIGISIILIVTVIGTIGSFLVMVLSSQNQQRDAQRLQQESQAYQKQLDDYQKKASAQATELSAQYYPAFSQYASTPSVFDAGSVKSVQTTDLLAGNGAVIDDATQFAAYYIGWTPDGKIFDQSIANGALKAPFAINGLGSASVIQGWKDGLKGMKIGGVRLIEIPSDKGYGSQGSSDASGKQTIAPDTPLKFVVMAIPQPAAIPQPTIPADLAQGLGR